MHTSSPDRSRQRPRRDPAPSPYRHKLLFLFAALSLSLPLALLLLPNPNPNPNSCLPSLHALNWNSQTLAPISWNWPPRSPTAGPCSFRKLRRPAASALLAGKSVLFAGDSQARLLALALLRLLLDPSAVPAVEAELFRRHSDYRIALPDRGIQVDFVWAPFEANITELIRRLGPGAVALDVLVVGSGLWHMLHLSNAALYGEGLVELRREVVGLVGRAPVRAPCLFWIGLPVLVRPMLNSEEKRERMNSTVWEEYDRRVGESLILRGDGGPFWLLDVGHLSRGCGPRCTVDGMHYDGVVYEAAMQIMLNALLIESRGSL